MSLLKLKIFTVLLFLSSSALGPSLRAQTPTAQLARPLIKLKVSLIDRKARAVTAAKKEDFQVTDDGNPEEIEFFAKDETPIIYGIVIDCTGSLKTTFPEMVAAAKQLIATNRDLDQAFIIKFVSSD